MQAVAPSDDPDTLPLDDQDQCVARLED